jgi:rubrerythrin
MNLKSFDDLLRFAIRREADSAAFYRMAAERANPGIKKAFEELAIQEDGHKKNLEQLDLSKYETMDLKEIKGLGLSELLEDVPYTLDMDYTDLLRMAIKKEEKSQKLYASIAKIVSEEKLKTLLLILAKEESTHKEKLEAVYDEEILRDF